MSLLSETGTLLLLDLESLEKLRQVNPVDIWNFDLEALVATHELNLVDSGLKYDESAVLVPPLGNNKMDKENCATIYTAFGHLNAVQAKDERLWVSLALGLYRDYVQNRYPLPDIADAKNHVQNHIFAITSRTRYRDQAISRLWWLERYIVTNCVGLEMEARSVLLDLQIDLMTAIITRTNLAAVPNLAKAVINEFFEKFVVTGQVPNRLKYRAFLSSIDVVAGRQVVSALPATEIDKLVKAKFSLHMS